MPQINPHPFRRISYWCIPILSLFIGFLAMRDLEGEPFNRCFILWFMWTWTCMTFPFQMWRSTNTTYHERRNFRRLDR